MGKGALEVGKGSLEIGNWKLEMSLIPFNVLILQVTRERAAAAERPDHGQPRDQPSEDQPEAVGRRGGQQRRHLQPRVAVELRPGGHLLLLVVVIVLRPPRPPQQSRATKHERAVAAVAHQRPARS